MLSFGEERPIFIQIAQEIENAVLSGAFPEESQLPSINEIAVRYKINPATALKGINLLVYDGIAYKKRGIGMFVAQGAASKIEQKRKEEFFDNFIQKLIDEAKKLDIGMGEIMAMVERGYADEQHKD